MCGLNHHEGFYRVTDKGSAMSSLQKLSSSIQYKAYLNSVKPIGSTYSAWTVNWFAYCLMTFKLLIARRRILLLPRAFWLCSMSDATRMLSSTSRAVCRFCG